MRFTVEPDGMMSDSELAFLRAIVLSLPEGAQVVELGSWKGLGSTLAFCQALTEIGGHLTAVDTFRGDEHIGEVDIQSEFRNNTAQFKDVIDIVVGDTVGAATQFRDATFDCIFIDATHTYAAARTDIEAWAPKVASGGLMCGHDYGHYGLTLAVNERFGSVGVFETIWYTRSRPRTHWRYRAEAIARRLAH
jgi:predicted O-methyltransferase YrrM